MSTEFPLNMFPVQLFPDLDLERVSVDKGLLTLSVTESEWAISEDMEYFFGEGDMLFQFSGDASIDWKNTHEEVWHKSDHDILPRLTMLEFIRRQDNGSWLFQFSNREEDVIVSITLNDVTRIEWTGEADEDMLNLGASLVE